MDDLISRQEAIKAVHEEFDECLVWDESGETTADEVELILDRVPSVQPKAQLSGKDTTKGTISDCISRQATIRRYCGKRCGCEPQDCGLTMERDGTEDCDFVRFLKEEPPVQPERLTDDDLETIRIHLSAMKEKLCNQRRWKEAEEYERIISRLITLEFVQSEPHWIPCSERLPEKQGEYRITWITSASRKRFIGDAEFEVTNVEHDRFTGEWLFDDYIKNYPDVSVLAWKPLEEPWGGGRDE